MRETISTLTWNLESMETLKIRRDSSQFQGDNKDNDSNENRASNTCTSESNHLITKDGVAKCEMNYGLTLLPWIRPTEFSGNAIEEVPDEYRIPMERGDIRRFTKKIKKKILIKGKREEVFEKSKEVLTRRTKQIDYGKNTIGYQTYLVSVPKETRTKEHPCTPNKYLKFSRRSWEKQIRIWRKRLHFWDPPHEDLNIPECDILDLATSLSAISDSQDSTSNDLKSSASSKSITSDSVKSEFGICYSSENIREFVSSCQEHQFDYINFENAHTSHDELYTDLETNVSCDECDVHTVKNLLVECNVSGDFEPL